MAKVTIPNDRDGRNDQRIWALVGEELGLDHVPAAGNSGGGACGSKSMGVHHTIKPTEPSNKELKLYATNLALGARRYDQFAAMPADELENKYGEHLDRTLLFDDNNATADFEYWLKMPVWTIFEGIALLLNLNPETAAQKVEKARHAPTAKKYKANLEIARRYVKIKQELTYNTKPSDFIAWADNVGIEAPKELLTAYEVSTGKNASSNTPPPAWERVTLQKPTRFGTQNGPIWDAYEELKDSLGRNPTKDEVLAKAIQDKQHGPVDSQKKSHIKAAIKKMIVKP